MKTHIKRRATMAALRDDGSALVITLGVMMVGAVILVTLAMAAVANSKQTSLTRTEARALQSADAGIDLVASLLEGKKYSELGDIWLRSQLFLLD